MGVMREMELMNYEGREETNRYDSVHERKREMPVKTSVMRLKQHLG